MNFTFESNESKFLLRIADTSLILAQRLAEMCSKGPFLEEDIALSNTSLDLFGRAEELYKIICRIENDKFEPDELVYKRNERQFYNLKLVEQPNEDFAWVIVRQFLHDVYAKEVFTELLKSENSEVVGLSQKVLKEIKYSHLHAKDWIERLGLGTEESNSRTQSAVNHILKYIEEIFNFDDIDKTYLSNTAEIESKWNAEINAVFAAYNITRIEVPPLSMRDYRDGFHSEYMGPLLSVMQYLPRAYPDAKW
ncbi:1,2-phenylacetyl-CoA epoxidase subunit PaaC [Crocinitomix catalasitica]|uniref:1,2-phenylacetyl-CoA epoxidase subunit PaaC n=1 Tax=Crocinitomix catalasitica TaxID=184607 RepID=UPI000486C7B5|nr:1,2-phenylacetyl-CoA epoxidase subunit PaaC [Crocinitomix catalasitica]